MTRQGPAWHVAPASRWCARRPHRSAGVSPAGGSPPTPAFSLAVKQPSERQAHIRLGFFAGMVPVCMPTFPLSRCAATVGSRRPRGRAEGPPCGVAMVAGAVLAGVGGQPGPQVSGRGTSPPTAIPHWAVRCSLPRQSGLEALLRLRLPVRGRAEPGGLAGEARGQGTRALGLPCGGNQSRKAGPGSTAPHPEASAYWFAAHWTRP